VGQARKTRDPGGSQAPRRSNSEPHGRFRPCRSASLAERLVPDSIMLLRRFLPAPPLAARVRPAVRGPAQVTRWSGSVSGGVLCWPAFPLVAPPAPPPLARRRRLLRCRVGRGGAYALPLPARSNGSCSFPASRFPMWTPLWRRGRSDAGREIDQPHKSELLHQPWKWILSPHRVSPFLGDERT
jgi:hypothetical protein